MTTRTQLLIIDPQNDFCDLPPDWWPRQPLAGGAAQPALPVAGAHADMQRLAAFVAACGERLDAICVTLDSHHRLDIAHPAFWTDGEGAPVPPFSSFGVAELQAGLYRPRDPAWLPRALAYLQALEAQGRYRLMVWPVHCEIGSWGHAIHAELQAALGAWEEGCLRQLHIVHKGDNPWTEHYSALQAEVPDATDPGTQLNAALIARLDQADRILIAGEAGSHCVRATTEHLAAHLPSGRLDKLVLLSDCISPVAGFEAQQQDFFAQMQALGLRLASSAVLRAELLAQ